MKRQNGIVFILFGILPLLGEFHLMLLALCIMTKQKHGQQWRVKMKQSHHKHIKQLLFSISFSVTISEIISSQNEETRNEHQSEYNELKT